MTPRNFFSRIKEKCQLINGIYDTTISRNEAWNFAKLGQFIERADKTAIVLDVKYHMLLPNIKAVGTPIDLLQWSALLKSVSAYDMYRKKYGKINPTSICEFLIFDKTFPRSIMSCVENAYESLLAISGKDDLVYTEAYKQLGILKSSLEYTNAKAFLEEGLHDKLEEIKDKLDEISKAIYDTYFSTDNVLNSYQNQ